MIQLTLRDDLPFVTVRVAYGGRDIEIPDVLIDTGSASTVLSADAVAQVGIVPAESDVLHVIRGVGGTEVAYSRCVDRLQLGDKLLSQFEVEIGAMDYGFQINGIIGMDVLVSTGAVINLQSLHLSFQE